MRYVKPSVRLTLAGDRTRLRILLTSPGMPLTKELEEPATEALAGTVVEEVTSEVQEAVITEVAADGVGTDATVDVNEAAATPGLSDP